jgi:hypothetical protein
MRQMTLLEIVQDILSDLDSDEVNSINDTVEATQVANTVRSVYEHLIDSRDWPHLYAIYALDSSTDVSLPTLLSLPTNVEELMFLKYNKKKSTDVNDRYEDVKYKLPEDFINICNKRNSSDSTVEQITISGVTLNVLNNVAPTYYTSFDNDTIICDSYDNAVDSILQSSKTQARGKRLPIFTLTDTFIPDLPVNAFALLVNESKSACSLKFKQTADQKAEQYSVTNRRKMSQEAWRVTNGISYPDYGRGRKK